MGENSNTIVLYMKEKTFLSRAQSIILPPFETSSFKLIHLRDIRKKEVTDATKLLDKPSQDYSNRYLSENDRNHSIIIHAILRHHLSSLLKCKANQLAIKRDKSGKPYIEGYPLHFNLSHCKEYGFIGFHPTFPIGVDIESIKRSPDLLKSPILTSSERMQILNSSNPTNSFYKYWCGKEALLKAIGTGFFQHPLPFFDQLNSTDTDSEFFHSENLKVFIYPYKLEEHMLAACLKSN